MIGRKRKYKSGTGWCFWRFTDVDSEYITRLHILKTPFFAICLHWLNKPDPEPYLHDHPVSFLSIILRGGYTEKRLAARTSFLNICTWWNYIRADRNDRHTIIDVLPGTVTLCFMGPKTRTWGYHTDKGWIDWKSYGAVQRALKLVP